MSKRIIYITSSFPFGRGESFIYPEIKSWQKLGYDLLVIPTFPRGEYPKESLALNVLALPLFRCLYLFSFIRMLITRPITTFRLVWELLSQPRTFIKNMSALLKGAHVAILLYKHSGLEHIHVHWGGVSSTFGYVLSQYLSVPWSMTCHRWDIYENNLLALKTKSSAFTRFISNKGMKDALSIGASVEKSVVITMGVESTNRTVTKLTEGIPKIVCAANIIPVKGHRFLLEAARKLLNEGVVFELDIYGDGELKNEMIGYSNKLGLQEVVFFKGYVSHEQLLQKYSNASVTLFILPSIDLGNGLHEGVPVSLMEAMSFGVPVISTTTGSINELLPESLGLTVPGSNSLALAALIKRMLSDSEFYLATSEHVFTLINESWLVDLSIIKMKKLVDIG